MNNSSKIMIRITAADAAVAEFFESRLEERGIATEINIDKRCTEYKIRVDEGLPFLLDHAPAVCASLQPFCFESVEFVEKIEGFDFEILLGTTFQLADKGIEIIAHSADEILFYQKLIDQIGTGGTSYTRRQDNPAPLIIYGDESDQFLACYLAWRLDMPRATEFIHDAEIVGPFIAIYAISNETRAELFRDCLPIIIQTDDEQAGLALKTRLKSLGFKMGPNFLIPSNIHFHSRFSMNLMSICQGTTLPHDYPLFTKDLTQHVALFLQDQLDVSQDDYPFLFESRGNACTTGMVINLPYGLFKREKMPAYDVLGKYDCLILTDKPKKMKALRKRFIAAGMASVEISQYEEPMLEEVVFAKSIIGDDTAKEKVLNILSAAIDTKEIDELKFRYSLYPLASIVIRLPVAASHKMTDNVSDSSVSSGDPS